MAYSTLPATILLALCSVGGAIDFIYLHLWKYKLYSHEETLFEHKLHTAQTAMASATVFFLFCGNFGGILLWCGVGVALIGLVLEVTDLICERKSRTAIGGLSALEYILHFVMSGLRFAFVALMLGNKPPAAWDFSASFVLPQRYGVITDSVGWIVFLSGILLLLVHLWLIQRKYREAVYHEALVSRLPV